MNKLREYQLKQIELFKNRYTKVYIGENDKPTEVNLYDYLTDKSIKAGFNSYEELLQEGTNAFSESITNMSMNNLFADQYNTDNTEYFKKQSTDFKNING